LAKADERARLRARACQPVVVVVVVIVVVIVGKVRSGAAIRHALYRAG